MKLITFAVPCYNSAEYMDKCIKSLLLAGEEAEIIIVNDGSTKDNTAEIADGYAKEYPNIVKVIHKENGGHGDAVNDGIKNATGKYYKVVDSDDWVEEKALLKLMDTLRSFNEENSPQVVLSNYVYEYTFNNTQRVVHYRKNFPIEKVFDFEQIKKLETGKFIAMHSVTYKTEFLREVKLELPKHCFYVDNVFVFLPLVHAKTFYYIDVNLYRYFIGRPDQSVAENVIMKRIDQHIRVTKVLIESFDINILEKNQPKLYKYSLAYLSIMMTINSIYLIKIGTDDSWQKKKELWDYLKERDIKTYKKCKRRFTGLVATENKFVGWVCKVIYTVVRKIFKFN